ncbi:hypothetical protein K470DRAFT_261817 [Piedraia hortae CBS 480.64]|uniref:Uncharacterized protein n=1 Tax=Piedraia hortae CBS 480.64 TaxID=1314780 RepID=A0A6A7C8D3_9PEZI|nr:hypothetical protein K470DRAFT_261817 [Piedraia hortae CBS 480.64]
MPRAPPVVPSQEANAMQLKKTLEETRERTVYIPIVMSDQGDGRVARVHKGSAKADGLGEKGYSAVRKILPAKCTKPQKKKICKGKGTEKEKEAATKGHSMPDTTTKAAPVLTLLQQLLGENSLRTVSPSSTAIILPTAAPTSARATKSKVRCRVTWLRYGSVT